MQTSDDISKLAPALSKAQSAFKGVPKSGENKFDRYNYAKLEDYTESIRNVLEVNKFSLVTSIESVERLPDRTTSKGGTEHVAQVQLTVRLIHESGQWIQAGGFGEGQDRADKAIYKAITGGRKYALAAILGLATTDDPEGDEGTGNTPPPTSKKPNKKASIQDDAKGTKAKVTALAKELWSPDEISVNIGLMVKEFGANKFDELKPDQQNQLLYKLIEISERSSVPA